jgi:hypothetical protein
MRLRTLPVMGVATWMALAVAQSPAPTCAPPELFSPSYIPMTQSIGKNAMDLGNYDLCNTVGTYCLMQGEWARGAILVRPR